MHILLVEPAYYTRYPPLGLLKIASYHKLRGDTVELVRGCILPNHKPDLIYVTSLFTWAWEPVWSSVKHYKTIFPNVKVQLGGLYATLMPEHAQLSGADEVCLGVLGDVDNLMPAYDLVPNWNGSIVQTSRGCNRRCPFCAVWRIEGKINSTRDTIKHLVYALHSRIVLWDNNILQSEHWRAIFEELVWFSQHKRMIVDFNQGLDARLITDEVAQKISQMRTICVRISYDHKNMEQDVRQTIETLSHHGVRRRRIGVYILFNYTDTPNDFFERVKDVLDCGAVAVPLKYQPLDTLRYNSHVGPKWDKERLEAFAKFRRVCGFGGTFPPYKWLVERFTNAQHFDEAFQLPERNSELISKAHKDYFKAWRKNPNWRMVQEKFLAKRW